MMNSCPVLYFNLFDFLQQKKEKVFMVVQIYLHSVVLGGGAVGIVYPDVFATKWDEVVRKSI